MWQLTARWKWRRIKRLFSPNRRWCVLAIIPIAVATGLYETQTSALQARIFSSIARKLTYQVAAGPSSRIVFPDGGPFNQVRGYSQIPRFAQELVEHRFHIA